LAQKRKDIVIQKKGLLVIKGFHSFQYNQSHGCEISLVVIVKYEVVVLKHKAKDYSQVLSEE
jgi:hypothetical protein